MTTQQDQAVALERLLTPGEVAAAFRVEPRTVSRWARSGRLPAFRTLGGHRRFRSADVRAALAADDGIEGVGA